MLFNNLINNAKVRVERKMDLSKVTDNKFSRKLRKIEESLSNKVFSNTVRLMDDSIVDMPLERMYKLMISGCSNWEQYLEFMEAAELPLKLQELVEDIKKYEASKKSDKDAKVLVYKADQIMNTTLMCREDVHEAAKMLINSSQRIIKRDEFYKYCCENVDKTFIKLA